MKKTRLSIAIDIPISATFRAFAENSSFSFRELPYKETNKAPETLNLSVIVDDIEAFISKDSLVYPCNLRPTHLVGIKKTGNKVKEIKVICQESVSMVAATRIKLSRLLITPERVEVKACCAPMTSEFNLEIRAPV